MRFCQGESSGSGGSREPGAFGRSQTLDVTSRINDCPSLHLRPSSLHFLILKRRRWGWGSCRGRLAHTSVVSDSMTPWTVACQASLSMGFPGKNTGVGCHALLQGIFPTQGWNPGLQHCRQILDRLSHQGSIWHSSNVGPSPDVWETSRPRAGLLLTFEEMAVPGGCRLPHGGEVAAAETDLRRPWQERPAHPGIPALRETHRVQRRDWLPRRPLVAASGEQPVSQPTGLVPANLSNVSRALDVNSQDDTPAPNLIEGVRGGFWEEATFFFFFC